MTAGFAHATGDHPGRSPPPITPAILADPDTLSQSFGEASAIPAR
jgi:hypothetical protein